jgi:hypothetical protein
MSSSNLRIAGLATVAAMIVGGIGAWATASFAGVTVSVNGSDRDGVIIIVCAVIIAIGILAANRATSILAVVAALAATATAIYDFQDVGSADHVSVGWGLWIATLASIVAIALTVMQLRAAPSEPAAPPPPPPATPPA